MFCQKGFLFLKRSVKVYTVFTNWRKFYHFLFKSKSLENYQLLFVNWKPIDTSFESTETVICAKK